MKEHLNQELQQLVKKQLYEALLPEDREDEEGVFRYKYCNFNWQTIEKDEQPIWLWLTEQDYMEAKENDIEHADAALQRKNELKHEMAVRLVQQGGAYIADSHHLILIAPYFTNERITEWRKEMKENEWYNPISFVRTDNRSTCHSLMRLYVLFRDRKNCVYCGRDGNTLDHRIAKANGGLNTVVNLCCACERCNSIKGNLDYTVFEHLIQYGLYSIHSHDYTNGFKKVKPISVQMCMWCKQTKNKGRFEAKSSRCRDCEPYVKWMQKRVFLAKHVRWFRLNRKDILKPEKLQTDCYTFKCERYTGFQRSEHERERRFTYRLLGTLPRDLVCTHLDSGVFATCGNNQIAFIRSWHRSFTSEFGMNITNDISPLYQINELLDFDRETVQKEFSVWTTEGDAVFCEGVQREKNERGHASYEIGVVGIRDANRLLKSGFAYVRKHVVETYSFEEGKIEEQLQRNVQYELVLTTSIETILERYGHLRVSLYYHDKDTNYWLRNEQIVIEVPNRWKYGCEHEEGGEAFFITTLVKAKQLLHKNQAVVVGENRIQLMESEQQNE